MRPEWSDALVAIGLARLQTGDNAGARQYFHDVQRVSEKVAAELRASGAKDGFARKEAQPYLRACHALGCLAYDGKSYDETLVELARVYEVDQSAVGTEARLIAWGRADKAGKSGRGGAGAGTGEQGRDGSKPCSDEPCPGPLPGGRSR